MTERSITPRTTETTSANNGALDSANAVVDDEVIDRDIERETHFAEAITPFAGPVGGVRPAEEGVPDVLRLPEVYLHGESTEGLSDGEGFIQDSDVLRRLLFGCGFEPDHGALHSLVGGVAQKVAVESDVVDVCAAE